jgi:hypothetical protein
MENIVALFLHLLYLWTEALLSPVSISFSDFLVRFSLHTSSVLRGAPYAFFSLYKISFTYQKMYVYMLPIAFTFILCI